MPREAVRKSRLEGLLPVKDNAMLNRLAGAKRVQAKRTPLYNMDNEQKEAVLFPLKFLKEMGVEVPEMGDKAIFVTTGPNNGQLESKNGTFSFVLRGSDILYSINGGPRKKMNKRGLQG
ncbi:MAG: hypothetical protein GY852_06060 [bacterium]|nr:hypothetical protein [bacterium]